MGRQMFQWLLSFIMFHHMLMVSHDHHRGFGWFWGEGCGYRRCLRSQLCAFKPSDWSPRVTTLSPRNAFSAHLDYGEHHAQSHPKEEAQNMHHKQTSTNYHLRIKQLEYLPQNPVLLRRFRLILLREILHKGNCFNVDTQNKSHMVCTHVHLPWL